MDTQIDDELKQLAALALRNAFWKSFSALVNEYLDAAHGLDTEAQEMQMGELTSIYGRDRSARDSDYFINIWTQNEHGTTGHETILEALEHRSAVMVFLEGKKVFERVDGEWQFTGDA